ncbi:TetR family transcriptional regulator C-terminal domain-containing protein [Chitinophaga horti]|uniref:TetR family transcriptional regulator C-terminal domain-containing protein n=1 Tax=Chitinophaga horti TaxID=2920382 RepID=A0ABY6J238_9BACT|nr:TetR family transcriptional regulator C-terminal domain-containing protein [Chitinophaga horti]UYQ93643.1 TetR family transcriptional regulator C-terminal domain-containing protein [Chitinophaga horti]
MEKSEIRSAYEQHWLQNGKQPVSVFAFCQPLNITEGAFYDHYSSFDALENDIWLGIFQTTLGKLQPDETYQQYTAQEKLLAFYFMWVQDLKEHRSYILLQKGRFLVPGSELRQLETFRRAFYEYAADLIREGYQNEQIKERKYISDQYVHGFWLQALFVLRYWIKDTSERFEMTDAAIEKAVNLSFQLIRSNTLDSLLDFGKFILTRK